MRLVRHPGPATSPRARAAWELVLLLLGLGAALTIVEDAADPDGWVWTAARAAVSALWTAALVAWLVGLARGRRGQASNRAVPRPE